MHRLLTRTWRSLPAKKSCFFKYLRLKYTLEHWPRNVKDFYLSQLILGQTLNFGICSQRFCECFSRIAGEGKRLCIVWEPSKPYVTLWSTKFSGYKDFLFSIRFETGFFCSEEGLRSQNSHVCNFVTRNLK